MRWALRLAVRNPATWIFLIACLVLLAVMPSDRETARTMFEEACNTARAFVLYAAAGYCGVLWGSAGDARSEQAVHLGGVGFRHQRRRHAAAIAALVVAAPVLLVVGSMARWSAAAPASAAALVPSQAAMSSTQTLLYLVLTTVAVLALTTLACAGRPSSTAIPLAVGVPLVHTLVHFGVDVPGVSLLQDLWPTTAAGVIARGSGDGSGVADGAIAAVALVVVVALAVRRLSTAPSFGGDATRLPLRQPRVRPGDGQAARSELAGRRGWSRASASTIALVTVGLGVGPALLIHLPVPVRPSAWIQVDDGTDPVTTARDFVLAAQQGDLSRLVELTGTRDPAAAARQLPAPVLRGGLEGSFSLASSPRIDRATVVADYSGDAIQLVLARSDGRWLVTAVTTP